MAEKRAAKMRPFDDATTTAAALNHLAQGIYSGALKGDEFRSVAEHLPAILQAIIDEAGVTRVDLVRLAQGPGVPAKVIIGALMAVKHQQPRTAPDVSVAFALLSEKIRELAREGR